MLEISDSALYQRKFQNKPQSNSEQEFAENKEIEDLIASIKRKYCITEKSSQGYNREVSQEINDDQQSLDNFSNEIPHYDFLNDFSAIDGTILECLLEKSKKSS